MRQAIRDGRSCCGVAEKLPPFLERQIRGHDRRAALISAIEGNKRRSSADDRACSQYWTTSGRTAGSPVVGRSPATGSDRRPSCRLPRVLWHAQGRKKPGGSPQQQRKNGAPTASAFAWALRLLQRRRHLREVGHLPKGDRRRGQSGWAQADRLAHAPAHIRIASGDARSAARRRPEVARPRQHQDDDALRAPVSVDHPGCGMRSSMAQGHKRGTKCRTRSKPSEIQAVESARYRIRIYSRRLTTLSRTGGYPLSF